MKLYIPKEEDYFKSYSKELEEYIEKLEHENERIYTKLDDNDKEIERLNNIINELEKDLKEKIDEDRLNILSNSHWKYVLDKLQELKGSDKK